LAARLKPCPSQNRILKRGLNLNVRASMGLASFPHDAQTPHDIIRQADEMMYVVKNTTRDNIGVASRGVIEQ
jgi:GGDEF domain-containing protein